MDTFTVWHTRHYKLEVEAETEEDAVKQAENSLMGRTTEAPDCEDGWKFDSSDTQI